MRAVIQRVSNAQVFIEGHVHSSIDAGLAILLGIGHLDTSEDVKWLSHKIVNLRIMNDQNNVPNLSILDTTSDLLLISQFTLFASTKKGNRPGYSNASSPENAKPLYWKMIDQLEYDLGKKIFTGIFGADMKVSFLNDGPLTIFIDTKNKE